MTTSGIKIISFFLRQITDVKRGGFFTIINKSKLTVFLIIRLSLAILFVPFVIVIRAIKPIIHIRFGKLSSQRIGHLAFEPELYLCEREMGLHGKRTLDLFYLGSTIANEQLKLMWDRKLFICSKIVKPLFWANRCLPGFLKHIVPLHSLEHNDFLGLFDKVHSHLSFTPEEESYGKERLKLLGIPAEEAFICFIARDSAYLNKIGKNINWSYHDYRDSKISNYIFAAEKLVEKGYYLIRMGSVVKDPLPFSNDRIIDYATNGRDDFMDIYLLSKCKFFIVSNSGPCAVTTIFRKPNAFVNVAPFFGVKGISRSCDLFIPKKYWLQIENRAMTFSEIISSEACNFYVSDDFVEAGISLIENSPEEICDLALEMDKRLNGNWYLTEGDEILYKKYTTILSKNGILKINMPRIGSAFLRNNIHLLN